MSSDAGDPGTTDEHPPIFTGRAQPAVMTDSQLAMQLEPGYDTTVIPVRFPRKAGEPLSVVQPRHTRLSGRITYRAIAFVNFLVLAMLATALMIALAVR